MWTVAIYYGVLLLTVAVAMWRGGPLERWAAYTALLASVCTTVLAPKPNWSHIEYSIFAIDVVALASFWVIALKTQRFWPYWITGWQLIAIFGHVRARSGADPAHRRLPRRAGKGAADALIQGATCAALE